MSENNQPISQEIPTDLVAQLESIACNDSFAPEATLETAYEQLHMLVSRTWRDRLLGTGAGATLTLVAL